MFLERPYCCRFIKLKTFFLFGYLTFLFGYSTFIMSGADVFDAAGGQNCTTEIISLNVGGQTFKFCANTLRAKFPDALLARFARADHAARLLLCTAFLQSEAVYFFERSSRLFERVYRLYVNNNNVNGKTKPLISTNYNSDNTPLLLTMPPPDICCHDAEICIAEMRAEFAFWELPIRDLKTCRFCFRARSIQTAQLLHKSICDTSSMTSIESYSKAPGAAETKRQRIYRFCEGDGTLGSMLFITVSISFVIASVMGLVLGSIQDFQVAIPITRYDMEFALNQSQINKTTPTTAATTLPSATLPSKAATAATRSAHIIWEPLPIFSYLETTCIIWFTMEYFLRLFVAPQRLQFVCQLVNVVDLIAILPFYLEMFLVLCGFDVTRLSEIKGAFLVVRIMRVLRVVRILKLGRYSSGMRTFALTLRSSARQLGMMGMVLFTGVIFFSTLLYFVEKDEPHTPFTSIPAAFWWAIVTMSTVGYGDYVPATISGKLIASGAILSGVLVLALPITIIVDNFMKVSGSFSGNLFASGPFPPPPAGVTLTAESDIMPTNTLTAEKAHLPNGGLIRRAKNEPC